MQRRYYCIPDSHSYAKSLRKVLHKINKASEAAEKYAKKMGAESYIEDCNSLAGGVSALIFPKDEKVTDCWRLLSVSDEGEKMYLPNVQAKMCVRTVFGNETLPSNTATCIYSQRVFTWEEVHSKWSLSRWAEIAEYHLTGNKEADAAKIDEILRDKRFFVWTHLSGSPAIMSSNKAKKAVCAERLRLSLPVVSPDAIYSIFSVTSIEGENEEREPSTPVFFFYNGYCYVGLDAEITENAGMEEITPQQYSYHKNRALGVTYPGCE